MLGKKMLDTLDSICLMNHPKCSLLELELRLLKLLASEGGANIWLGMLSLVGRDFGPLCDVTKSCISKVLYFSLKLSACQRGKNGIVLFLLV